MSSPSDWNKQIIEEFRANGGKVGGQFAGTNLLLLHTQGAKSNQPHTTPLVYSKEGDDFILVAAKGGAPTNPDWYYNILAHPNVTLEVGTEHFNAHATIPEREERDRIFANISQQAPMVSEYQRKTSRVIPIITLKRV